VPNESDEVTLRATAREVIRIGKLPSRLPTERGADGSRRPVFLSAQSSRMVGCHVKAPQRSAGAPGIGEPCDACENRIDEGQLAMAVPSRAHKAFIKLHADATCFGMRSEMVR